MAHDSAKIETLAHDSGLVLEPLEAAHAPAMYGILEDAELYRFLDRGPPASVEALREQYTRLERRGSPDGLQVWLNWVVRLAEDAPIGFVQATVEGRSAWIAYMFAREAWGRGHAANACRAMIDHLAARHGVERFLAMVESENARSIRLLARLGFVAVEAPPGVTLSPTERLFAMPADSNP